MSPSSKYKEQILIEIILKITQSIIISNNKLFYYWSYLLIKLD